MVADSLSRQGWIDGDDAGEGADDSESPVSRTSVDDRKSRRACAGISFLKMPPSEGGWVMWETLPHKPQEDYPHEQTILNIFSMSPFTVYFCLLLVLHLT